MFNVASESSICMYTGGVITRETEINLKSELDTYSQKMFSWRMQKAERRKRTTLSCHISKKLMNIFSQFDDTPIAFEALIFYDWELCI